ncbi:hypothetical protein D3C77_373360 [compost metagenome]
MWSWLFRTIILSPPVKLPILFMELLLQAMLPMMISVIPVMIFKLTLGKMSKAVEMTKLRITSQMLYYQALTISCPPLLMIASGAILPRIPRILPLHIKRYLLSMGIITASVTMVSLFATVRCTGIALHV